MKQSKRTQRVSELVQREVGTMLLNEGHERQLSNVVLTDCQVSPDLRIARLYYTLLAEGDDRREAIEKAQESLEAASGHLRYRLGRVIRTKYTPELHFHFDETLERARRIEDALEALGPLDAEPTEQP